MAHQATMNGGLRFRTPEGVIGSIGEFTSDVMTLAELQAKLTAVDLKESVTLATVPVAVLVVAGTLLAATLPVLLIGLAFVLAGALGITQGAALLIVGGLFAVVAGVVALVATQRLLKSFNSMRRSREELARNLSWIRTVISQSSRAVNRPGA